MTVAWTLHANDVLHLREVNSNWLHARLRPLDTYGVGVEIREGDKLLGYEFIGFERDLFADGTLDLPFDEPDFKFEINEAPGLSFTLKELLLWIHEQVNISV